PNWLGEGRVLQPLINVFLALPDPRGDVSDTLPRLFHPRRPAGRFVQWMNILPAAIVEVEDVEELFIGHVADDARHGLEPGLSSRARSPVTGANFKEPVGQWPRHDWQPRPEAALLHARDKLGHSRFGVILARVPR